jgi:hypothetical protein
MANWIDRLFGRDDGTDQAEEWRPIPQHELDQTDREVRAQVGICPQCGGPGDGTCCDHPAGWPIDRDPAGFDVPVEFFDHDPELDDDAHLAGWQAGFDAGAALVELGGGHTRETVPDATTPFATDGGGWSTLNLEAYLDGQLGEDRTDDKPTQQEGGWF